ncbi:MAG: hypothetical protein QOE14_212 [Humisphaera sp.]|nr:hypothetical protein [Humisphaera sp.]
MPGAIFTVAMWILLWEIRNPMHVEPAQPDNPKQIQNSKKHEAIERAALFEF